MLNIETESNIDITFFVPCYNEEQNVESTIVTIVAAIDEVSIPYEILIVDDCSSDNTTDVVEDFMKENPDIPILLKKNEINRGLGRNYIDGAYIGHGKYYMLVNGDNAEPKETIEAIIKRIGDGDMIIPNFGNCDQRPPWRRTVSHIFTCLVNLLSGYNINYYNGPVAHLRFNVMRWHPDTHGFAYQAEIITRLLDEGASYVEVVIFNEDRQYGVSKAFTIQNIMSIAHSLLQIFLRRLRRVLYPAAYKHRK